jgi:Tfp pilus assembly protein PilZ
MQGRDLRRHRRYEVENVDGSFLFNQGVNVLNLSVAGMAVMSNHQLRVGRCYSFKIEREKEQLEVRGTVAWCVLRNTKKNKFGDVAPVYHAGIRFDEPESEEPSELEHLIEQNVILEVTQPVSGRFRLTPEARVELDDIVPFEVRRISLSGMLAESRLEAVEESVFPVEITLANGLFAADGRVAFVQPLPSNGVNQSFHLGVEFRKMSEASRSRLEEYIGFLVSADEPKAL